MDCKSCLTKLLPNARFCHHCGKESKGKGVVCLACNHTNPANARFCSNCGTAINIQYRPNLNISPRYGLDFGDIPTFPTQLHLAFLSFLTHSIEQEQQQHKEHYFLDCFQNSSFVRQHLEEATILMTQLFEELFVTTGASALVEIELQIDKNFLLLLECFLINYCPQICPSPLPKAILNYQKKIFWGNPKSQMIRDYLATEEENLTVYHAAIEIPLKKSKNALKTFFSPQKGEFPLFFLDNTLLKSGKEGIILTSAAIYWKHHFHPKAQVEFKDIKQLQYFKDRIEINGIYLNISPSFNYKFYRLLSRLKLGS